jgi:hypothetical protein
MQAQRPAGIAARTGLITGLFVGVLSLPVITISGVTGRVGLRLLFLAVALVAFAIAGYLATRHSGLLRSGVGAGALAAAVAMFIAICFGTVIVALMTPYALLGAGRGIRIRRMPLARLAFIRLFLQTLLILGAGVLGGFLGGLLGRLGRPRQPAAPQFAPSGPAPQFAPGGFTAPFTPAGNAVTPGGFPSQPAYPPTPYDPDAPTTVDPS